jgi:hypothetical protein
VEIDQVYKAPSIPKLNRRNIKSTLISGAIKPGVELKKTKFSFIKPLSKLIPDSLVPIKEDENKGSLGKNIQSGVGIQKLLEQSNKILSQIKEQLSLDFLSRINQEKKELAENKKRIAAEKVKDKEKKIESGGKGLLGGTLNAVVAPAKSIFQKLLDFFSIILTGILVNTAFKWLQKPENQEKLKKFFQFLKDYWQELLIVFGAVKLLGLVRKIWKVANAIKGLIDFFKKKPQLPCNCPKSPAQKGLDDCLPLKDCIDSLVKNPRRNGPMLEALASLIIATSAFEPVRKLLNQKGLPVPPTPASSAAPPPPQATTPVTAKQAVQQNQATPSPQLAASNAIKQQNIPKNLQPVVQQLITQYYQSGFKKTSKEVGEDIISVEAINSTGVFTQRNYNPKVIFSPGLATRRRQAGTSPGEQFALGAISLISSLPGRGVRPSTRLPITTRTRPLTTPEPVAPSAKPKIQPAPQSTRTPEPTPIPTPQSGVNSIVRLRRNPTRGQILNERTSLIQKTKGNTTDLKRIYDDKNAPFVTRIAAHQLLKEKNINLPSPTPQTSTPVKNSKGGTIPGLAGGGTVGGPGRMGIDSVPAMIASGAKTMMGGANALLAPGEEVIKTSSAMLFRPLLKDINDNAGRLWQAFTNAVRKQNLNETIVTDLIGQFGKIIEEFKDLLDKEATNIQRKGRTGGATGGTLNPRRIVPPAPAKSLSPSSSSPEAKPQKMPSGNMNMMKVNLPPPPSQKITPSQVSTIEPKITLQNPVDITQNIIQPQFKVPSAEKTLVDNTKLYVIPLKETVPSFKTASKSPTINHITLPTKTVNLGGSPKPKSLPSSSSGTSLPSISPIDESNDYVFTTPSMYGILV